MSTVTLPFTAASPTSKSLEQSLSATLTHRERLRLGLNLGSALLAVGLLIVGVAWRHWGQVEQRVIAESVLALASLIVLLPVLIEAGTGLLRPTTKTASAHLVTLGALAAFVVGDFVTAALIPIVLSVGHFIEERSVLGARAAIDGLKSLQARVARVMRGGVETEVDVATLQPGDVLVLRAGETIPADGEVQSGRSTIDQASITGESTPAEVGPGATVFAGTSNLTGLLRVTVTRTGDQTALGRVLHLLQDAEQSKTPTMRLIEQYAGYYVPLVLLIAAVTLFASRELSRAIAVLVVGCPMALILAGPTAMVAALAAASRLGILIKNAKFLEVLGDVDTVVFDKTGTVTLGQLEVVGVAPLAGVTNDEVLEAAGECARHSWHPVSKAIARTWPTPTGDAVDSSDARNVRPEITEHPGRGIELIDGSRRLWLGQGDWLASLGMSSPETPPHEGPLVWVAEASNNDTVPRPLGCVMLADQPRAEAREVIAELKLLGVEHSILLTGDRREVAERIGQTLNVAEVIAEVLPEQKLDVVHRQSREGRITLMVGDGINDALALAAADVGIALGAGGQDIAMRSADLVLMTNDLGRLPSAVRLSRQTRGVIHQNVLVGTTVSVTMVALAAGGMISPIAGAALHHVGELYVLLNSARLLRFS
jgi:heavy metal translocating P-type ATPase